jgi:hypothetical protein
MHTTRWLLVFTLFAACKGTPNPADCTEKHDIGACQKLCESGKPENQHFCYAERAFKMADCVDKNQSCAEACDEWASREKLAKMGDSSTSDLIKGMIGDKYDKMASHCPGASGSAAPAGSAQ